MIVHRKWFVVCDGRTVVQCEGWYLFGCVPLYVRDVWSERTKPN